jgi:2-polyprenyl-3-methyl-5-hydroxy-6-metoxy-1,4-benzoquinol methylase
MFKKPLLTPLQRALRIRKIVKYIPDNSNLCDVGCGANAFFLKSICSKIASGTGITLKVTARDYDDKIKLLEHDIRKTLPIQSAMFDCVTLLAVIEHLDHPSFILEECYRILKSEGVLVLTTPTPQAKPVLEILSKLGILSRNAVVDHKHYFSGKEIKDILERVGFRRITAETFQFNLNNLVIAYR